MGKRLPDVKVNVAFLLLDAGHDTYEILLRPLDIFLCAGNEKFPCLHDIARLVFV